MLYCINRTSSTGNTGSGSAEVGELMALEMVINGMRNGDTITMHPVLPQAKEDAPKAE
jgi:hypothetical protein